MRVKRRKISTRPKAATEDVIGNPKVESENIPRKWKPYFNRLVRLRQFLLNRQGGLVEDARQDNASAFSLHMADAGTDSFDRDLALSRASSEQDALYEIDQAINRMREGTYGKCELTGAQIEPERLDAIPWARFSVEAERKLEREGEISRARLAPSEPVSRNETANLENVRNEQPSDE